MQFSLPAPAKLNLFLHVVGKRDDGYHLLESLVVFTKFGDRLDFSPADDFSLEVTGPFAHGLAENNLITRAANLLDPTRGAHIRLHKHIPVGAGLGGGSSDAATALLGLARLWDIPTDDPRLMDAAQKLGADVPVCLLQRPAFMQGVGEQVTPVAMKPALWVLLVNPNIPLLTADVFRAHNGHFSELYGVPPTLSNNQALHNYIRPARNDLTAAAIQTLPVTTDILRAIEHQHGCLLSRMSGSGATCFGLFDNESLANAAKDAIQTMHPQWWIIVSALHG